MTGSAQFIHGRRGRLSLADCHKPAKTNYIDYEISRRLAIVNCMISWWTINQNHVHEDPNVAAKCGRVIRQLENYRNSVYGKSAEFRQHMARVVESYKHRVESSGFKNDARRADELARELCRAFDNNGHYFQALITKRFHESDQFEITDVEVKDGSYDFDVEIADGRGCRYCIEVWLGQTKYSYATKEGTSIVGVYDGGVYSDPGSVPDRLADVASDRGGISIDSEHDLPKIWRKLAQLPGNRVGFLVACRRNGNRILLGRTDFPIVPPECMPPNKCIIVLNFGGDEAPGGHGSAFIVHHPDFKLVKVAKKIIQSLEFKHDQGVYAEKIRLLKQYDLR